MLNVFMKRALELAKLGAGFTSPNPCVGVVIEKGGRIVAEGYHKKAGDAHAEIVAIRDVMKKSGIITVDLDPALFQNATLYVTLEPCAHMGKTPPCVNTLVEAGFKKVCVGMKDPFKKVNGRGIRFLEKNGVTVEVCKGNASLAREIREINQPFIKWASMGLPYVVLKAGVSLDGKIATFKGKSKWITGSEARQDARMERSFCDAVLVGAGTVREDNPELAPQGKFRSKKLLRIVIDPKLSLDLGYKIFRDENVFVACTDAATLRSRKRFTDAGVNFKSFGKSEVNLKRLLKFLAEKKKILSLFVEGGSKIHGSFCDAAIKDPAMVDQVIFYVAPKIIGGNAALSAVGGEGASDLKKNLNLTELSYDKIGEDLKIKGLVNFY